MDPFSVLTGSNFMSSVSFLFFGWSPPYCYGGERPRCVGIALQQIHCCHSSFLCQ